MIQQSGIGGYSRDSINMLQGVDENDLLADAPLFEKSSSTGNVENDDIITEIKQHIQMVATWTE